MIAPAGTFHYVATVDQVPGRAVCRTRGAGRPWLRRSDAFSCRLAGYDPELIICSDQLLFLASGRRFATNRIVIVSLAHEAVELLRRGDIIEAARGYSCESALAVVREGRLVLGLGHLALLSTSLSMTISYALNEDDLLPGLPPAPDTVSVAIAGETAALNTGGEARVAGYRVVHAGGAWLAIGPSVLPPDFLQRALRSLSLDFIPW